VEVGKEGDEALMRAAQPIHATRHHDIEAATGGVFAEGVEGGALVPPLRAAHAMVAVDLYNGPAGAGRDLAQFPLLAIRSLLVGGYAEIECGAHGVRPFGLELAFN
jgi:hypothetical protein